MGKLWVFIDVEFLVGNYSKFLNWGQTETPFTRKLEGKRTNILLAKSGIFFVDPKSTIASKERPPKLTSLLQSAASTEFQFTISPRNHPTLQCIGSVRNFLLSPPPPITPHLSLLITSREFDRGIKSIHFLSRDSSAVNDCEKQRKRRICRSHAVVHLMNDLPSIQNAAMNAFVTIVDLTRF